MSSAFIRIKIFFIAKKEEKLCLLKLRTTPACNSTFDYLHSKLNQKGRIKFQIEFVKFIKQIRIRKEIFSVNSLLSIYCTIRTKFKNWNGPNKSGKFA